jgi:wyosine [tRNA(Phe)-imidazoG37] synthetase (radical SAM superfamily)
MKFFLHLTKIYMKKKINEPNFVINHKYSVPLQEEKNKKSLLNMTIIYPSPIFGPVHSRRLGISLGINLMPADGKVCTFDCIYCECGLNAERRPTLPRPSREEVAAALEKKLREMAAEEQHPDVLTFAGNGEPTAHPQFAGIIDDTIRLRDLLCPKAKVSVLSNATQLHRPDVVEALLRVDNNIQKLDTVDADFIRRVDRPVSPRYDVEQVIEQLQAFRGHVIIQTMFLRQGVQGGLDNTSDYYVLPWLEAVKRIQPEQVMVYTIDSETPVAGLTKATHEELDRIRDLVIAAGISCSASY